MAILEQVERLREKANVSYDDAKIALDATNGDLLDAIIYLEKEGKVSAPAGGGYYNSQKSGGVSDEQTVKGQKANNGDSFLELMKRFGRFCAKLINKGNTNTFEVTKGGEVKTSFPITALVLLVVFLFWITIPLIIIGLFFGFRYRFRGPDLGKDAVNDVMDSAANAVDNLKGHSDAKK